MEPKSCVARMRLIRCGHYGMAYLLEWLNPIGEVAYQEVADRNDGGKALRRLAYVHERMEAFPWDDYKAMMERWDENVR